MTVASDNLDRLTTALAVPTPDGDPDDGYVLYAGGGDYAVHLSIHTSPVAALEHYAAHVAGQLPFRCVLALIAMEAAAGTFDVELPPPTAEQYVAQIVDRLGIEPEDAAVELHPSEPILLIEENERGGNPPYYLTTHATVADALDYNATQECAGDWWISEIHDLREFREVADDEISKRVGAESISSIGARLVGSESPLVAALATFAVEIGDWYKAMGLDGISDRSGADQIDGLYEILNRHGLRLAIDEARAALDLLVPPGADRPSVDIEDDRITVWLGDDTIPVRRAFDSSEDSGYDVYVTLGDGNWTSIEDFCAKHVDLGGDAEAVAQLITEVMHTIGAFAYGAAARAVEEL